MHRLYDSRFYILEQKKFDIVSFYTSVILVVMFRPYQCQWLSEKVSQFLKAGMKKLKQQSST